jgi:signal peptidase I
MQKIKKDSLFKDPIVKEAISLLNALLVALFIRTFLYQPFVIPSESMYPTLMVGDFLFVNKFVYGYSNRTFPLAPNIIENRIFEGPLKRGDVIVFHNPKHTNEKRQPDPVDYIKRLVGLPGDRIQMRNGVLHINDEPVKLEQIEDYQMVDSKGNFRVIPQYIETLPNGIKHPILKSSPMGRGWLDNTEEYIVPEGHYFGMGDNRDDSQDSRVLKAVGYIPAKNIIGRADLIFLSHLGDLWKPWTWLNIRYDRWPHLIH